jgi:hypothetical protein
MHILDLQKNLNISITLLVIQNVSTGNKLLEITWVRKHDDKNKLKFVLPYRHCSQLGLKTKFECDFHNDYSVNTAHLKQNPTRIRHNYWQHTLTYACLVYVCRWPCPWKLFHMYSFQFENTIYLIAHNYHSCIDKLANDDYKKMLKFTNSYDFLIFNQILDKIHVKTRSNMTSILLFL